MTSREELTRTIIEVIQDTLVLKGNPPVALTVDSPIDESLGLESLDWASIVAVLEEKTLLDPFQHGLKQGLQTVSDLVDLYVSETNRATRSGESVR